MSQVFYWCYGPFIPNDVTCDAWSSVCAAFTIAMHNAAANRSCAPPLSRAGVWLRISDATLDLWLLYNSDRLLQPLGNAESCLMCSTLIKKSLAALFFDFKCAMVRFSEPQIRQFLEALENGVYSNRYLHHKAMLQLSHPSSLRPQEIVSP
jgi:hypothetical protein